LPGGGNTNTGNTTRCFFHDPEAVSKITGVNEELIHRFAVIINVITSNKEIDVEKFCSYCTDTEKLYLSLYSWHHLPPTIHKILHYGAEVIEYLTSSLPIKAFSAEALEARHKSIRQFRGHHAQKTSQEASTRDVINMLLVSSDPVIASFWKEQQEPWKSMLP